MGIKETCFLNKGCLKMSEMKSSELIISETALN